MEKKSFAVPNASVKQYASGGEEPEYQYRYYTWDEINAGDCHQINGTLVFRSDGVVTFDAIVWTDHTDSGDVWHSSFSVSDNDNVYLLSLDQRDSPTTHGAHVSMHGQWNYPSELYVRLPTIVGRVTQASSC